MRVGHEGWPLFNGDGGTGCLEGDSGLGIEGFGGLRSTKGTTSI